MQVCKFSLLPCHGEPHQTTYSKTQRHKKAPEHCMTLTRVLSQAIQKGTAHQTHRYSTCTGASLTSPQKPCPKPHASCAWQGVLSQGIQKVHSTMDTAPAQAPPWRPAKASSVYTPSTKSTHSSVYIPAPNPLTPPNTPPHPLTLNLFCSRLPELPLTLSKGHTPPMPASA